MRMRSVIVAGLVGLAVLAGTQVPAAAGSEPAIDMDVSSDGMRTLDLGTAATYGPYYLQVRHSNMCLEVPGASRTEGVGLDQWKCVAQANEWWYLDHALTWYGDDYFRIRSAHSGLCMNVAGGSTANGARVIQYRCGSYANEYFRFYADPSMPYPYFWVEAFHSEKVLNIAGGSTALGADLIQYTRGFYSNEYIKLIPV